MKHHRQARPVNNGLSKHPLLVIVGITAYIVLMMPVLVLIGQAVSGQGWQDLPDYSVIVDALWLSLWTTGISMLIILFSGLPLAYIFARWRFVGKSLASVLIELPIVMPPAVAGLALLLTFGRRGMVGNWLADQGVTIPFTSVAVIVAQVFVAAPFFIRAAQIGFSDVPEELEDAARVDGASEVSVFLAITLPLSLRAIAAGLVLSWARALGEFGATLLFAGSLQGRTQTMPLLVYAVFERDLDAAIWTAMILLAMAFLSLLVSYWLRNRSDFGVS